MNGLNFIELPLWRTKSGVRRLGQKSRRDRDRRKRYPPNRGYRGLGWVQSFEERRLRVTKSHF